MSQLKRISPRKEPLQRRSRELRDAILQAATYVLKKEGALGFNTNRVAEKAGVNIASLYQYYPNKESLLFHMVEIEWNQTFQNVFPILQDKTKTCRHRLLLFIEKFYETEADEGELRHAMTTAGVAIENTREYQALKKKSDVVWSEFFHEAFPKLSKAERDFKMDFAQHAIFSFSETKPAHGWVNPAQDAKLMAAMICDYFKIA